MPFFAHWRDSTSKFKVTEPRRPEAAEQVRAFRLHDKFKRMRSNMTDTEVKRNLYILQEMLRTEAGGIPAPLNPSNQPEPETDDDDDDNGDSPRKYVDEPFMGKENVGQNSPEMKPTLAPACVPPIVGHISYPAGRCWRKRSKHVEKQISKEARARTARLSIKAVTAQNVHDDDDEDSVLRAF